MAGLLTPVSYGPAAAAAAPPITEPPARNSGSGGVPVLGWLSNLATNAFRDLEQISQGIGSTLYAVPHDVVAGVYDALGGPSQHYMTPTIGKSLLGLPGQMAYDFTHPYQHPLMAVSDALMVTGFAGGGLKMAAEQAGKLPGVADELASINANAPTQDNISRAAQFVKTVQGTSKPFLNTFTGRTEMRAPMENPVNRWLGGQYLSDQIRFKQPFGVDMPITGKRVLQGGVNVPFTDKTLFNPKVAADRELSDALFGKGRGSSEMDKALRAKVYIDSAMSQNIPLSRTWYSNRLGQTFVDSAYGGMLGQTRSIQDSVGKQVVDFVKSMPKEMKPENISLMLQGLFSQPTMDGYQWISRVGDITEPGNRAMEIFNDPKGQAFTNTPDEFVSWPQRYNTPMRAAARDGDAVELTPKLNKSFGSGNVTVGPPKQVAASMESAYLREAQLGKRKYPVASAKKDVEVAYNLSQRMTQIKGQIPNAIKAGDTNSAAALQQEYAVTEQAYGQLTGVTKPLEGKDLTAVVFRQHGLEVTKAGDVVELGTAATDHPVAVTNGSPDLNLVDDQSRFRVIDPGIRSVEGFRNAVLKIENATGGKAVVQKYHIQTPDAGGERVARVVVRMPDGHPVEVQMFDGAQSARVWDATKNLREQGSQAMVKVLDDIDRLGQPTARLPIAERLHAIQSLSKELWAGTTDELRHSYTGRTPHWAHKAFNDLRLKLHEQITDKQIGLGNIDPVNAFKSQYNPMRFANGATYNPYISDLIGGLSAADLHRLVMKSDMPAPIYFPMISTETSATEAAMIKNPIQYGNLRKDASLRHNSGWTFSHGKDARGQIVQRVLHESTPVPVSQLPEAMSIQDVLRAGNPIHGADGKIPGASVGTKLPPTEPRPLDTQELKDLRQQLNTLIDNGPVREGSERALKVKEVSVKIERLQKELPGEGWAAQAYPGDWRTATLHKPGSRGNSVESLAESMARNGWKGAPIEMEYNPRTGDYVVSNGHHRLLAAEQAGLQEVPTSWVYSKNSSMLQRIQDYTKQYPESVAPLPKMQRSAVKGPGDVRVSEVPGDPPAFTVTAADKAGNDVGQMVMQNKPGTRDYQMEVAQVGEKQRSMGYGKQMHVEAARQAEARGGRLTSGPLKSMSGDAKGLWESFVKDGKALRTKNGEYAMKPMLNSKLDTVPGVKPINEQDVVRVYALRAARAARNIESYHFIESMANRFGRPIKDLSELNDGEKVIAMPLLRNLNRAQVSIEDAVLEGMLKSTDMTEAITNAIQRVSDMNSQPMRAGLEKMPLMAVPEKVFERLTELATNKFATTGSKSLAAFRKATGIWKAMVLTGSPRWIYNNVLGNILFLKLQGGKLTDVVKQMDKKWLAQVKQTMSRYGQGVEEKAFFSESGGIAREGRRLSTTGETLGESDAAVNRMVNAVHKSLGGGKIRKGFESYAQGVRLLNSNIEDAFRRAAWMKAAEKAAVKRGVLTTFESFFNSKKRMSAIFQEGLDENSAHAFVGEVNKFMNDYAQMSPTGRDIIRPYIAPFWSFYRHAAKTLLQMPFEHPFKTRVIAQIAQGTDDRLQQLGFQGVVPSWMEGDFPIDKTAAGTVRFLSTQGPNPFNTVTEGPFEALNPIWKLMVEMKTGRDSFTGKPFSAPDVNTAFGSEQQFQFKRNSDGSITPVPIDAVQPSVWQLLTSEIPQYQTVKDLFAGGPTYDKSGINDALSGAGLIRNAQTGQPIYSKPRLQTISKFLGYNTFDFDLLKWQQKLGEDQAAALKYYLKQQALSAGNPPAATGTVYQPIGI